MFENRVLKKTFRPKRDGITKQCRRLHNETFYDLYSSPNTIRVCVEDKRGAQVVSVGKPGWRRHLDISGHENIILNGSSSSGIGVYGLD